MARVKIDLPNSEDFQWSIDIRKSQAVPPDNIKNELKRTIDKITSQSSRVYTKRGARISNKENISFWNEMHQHNKKSYKINLGHPLISSFLNRISSEDRNTIKEIFNNIESNLPIDTIYADMAIKPETIEQKQLIDINTLMKHAEDYWNIQMEMGISVDKIKEKILKTEPFNQNIQLTEEFIQVKENEC